MDTLTYSSPHSRTHSLSHTLTRALTQSHTHSLTHSHTHACSPARPPTYPPTHSLARSLTRCIDSFLHSATPSVFYSKNFMFSLICLLAHTDFLVLVHPPTHILALAFAHTTAKCTTMSPVTCAPGNMPIITVLTIQVVSWHL